MSINTTNTMSVFAEALIDNRNYKNKRIDGNSVGVSNSRKWANAVKFLRIPAYAVRVYRYNHMGDTETVAPYDQSDLYNALHVVLDMVGVVNGAKLDTHNVAEEIISNAMRFRTVDLTPEMAHAHAERRLAKKALDENETEETQANYDRWVEECETLEEMPGNCKRIAEIQSESAFRKSVEILLGDAIMKQTIKSAEEVAAEEEAKRQARRAKTAAKKAAAKAKNASAK